jgi:hypothetical protein
MNNELTKQTKIDIINQHIYSINTQIYNLNLTLQEEQAKEIPDLDRIEEIESMRPDMIRVISRLEELLNEIN